MHSLCLSVLWWRNLCLSGSFSAERERERELKHGAEAHLKTWKLISAREYKNLKYIYLIYERNITENETNQSLREARESVSREVIYPLKRMCEINMLWCKSVSDSIYEEEEEEKEKKKKKNGKTYNMAQNI